jgi:proteasome alpha subunit
MSGMYLSGYDRAITMFSPDGRLYQVEYAMEPVKKGWTSIGIKVDEGIALISEKRKTSPLMDVSATEKILLVDRHIGVSYAGLAPDARVLINEARVFSQAHRITYDEEPDVETVTRRVGDVLQTYTQNAGARPFGVALLIGGVSRAIPKLFMTDSSGAYTSYKAAVIGMYDQSITEFLKDKYSSDMKLEDASVLCLKGLLKAQQETSQAVPSLDPERVEIGIARRTTGLFVKLSQAELSAILAKATS